MDRDLERAAFNAAIRKLGLQPEDVLLNSEEAAGDWKVGTRIEPWMHMMTTRYIGPQQPFRTQSHFLRSAILSYILTWLEVNNEPFPPEVVRVSRDARKRQRDVLDRLIGETPALLRSAATPAERADILNDLIEARPWAAKRGWADLIAEIDRLLPPEISLGEGGE